MMKTQPVVHVLCGFIGAGKTTFAKELEAHSGAVRITKDEWLIHLFGNDPGIEGYAQYDRRICELTQDLAFQLLRKGVDVILDEGFWEREQRDDLRRRIEATGAGQVWYFIDTPIETIRERVAARNVNPAKDSFRIGRELLDVYLQSWQPPGEDEDYILVRDTV